MPAEMFRCGAGVVHERARNRLLSSEDAVMPNLAM